MAKTQPDEGAALRELIGDDQQPDAAPTSTAELAGIGESSRVIMARAFEALGGVDALVRWGREEKNREKFYRLWGQLCTPRTDPRTGVAPRGRYPTTGGGKAAVQITDFTDA